MTAGGDYKEILSAYLTIHAFCTFFLAVPYYFVLRDDGDTLIQTFNQNENPISP